MQDEQVNTWNDNESFHNRGLGGSLGPKPSRCQEYMDRKGEIW